MDFEFNGSSFEFMRFEFGCKSSWVSVDRFNDGFRAYEFIILSLFASGICILGLTSLVLWVLDEF